MLVYQIICTPINTKTPIELSEVYRTEAEAIEACVEGNTLSQWYHSFTYKTTEMNITFME